MLRVAHMFAGIGGGILASEILGHRSVLAVELDRRRCEILKQRTWEGWFNGLKTICQDIRKFNGNVWKGKVDCISAGFPCQDISSAGKGEGLVKGKRSSLFFELLRVIDQIEPDIIFLENSPFIRTRGRERVVQELLERGYAWKDGTLKASHVGAGHQRNRWWCIAANSNGMRKLEQERSEQKQRGWFSHIFKEAQHSSNITKSRREQGTLQQYESRMGNVDSYSIKTFVDACSSRLQIAVQQGGISETAAKTIEAVTRYTSTYGWNEIDSGVCGMVDGVSAKMERIKGLGDAQVPLQAALAWLLLTGV